MDRCPIEIWNQIFAHACTDNGYTGRSLSLVSRYIHETSKSAKLQSLSLTKPKQIHGLARLIVDTPPKYRQVRYLFIASPCVCEDESDDGGVHPAEGEGSTTNAAKSTARCITETDCRDVLAAFLRIIEALAPTLTILHVHFPFVRKSLFLPTSTTFPALVELTLYGPYTDYDDRSTTTSEEDFIEPPSLSDHPPPFPSLRRLHLADFYYNPMECFGRIACVAPSLTHLCLPYQSSMTDSLLAGLGARGISYPTSSSDSYGFKVGTLPLTIEMVLIDPGPPPTPFSWCGTGLMRHYTDMQNFKEVMKEDNRVFMLAERPNGMKDVEWYWLDRIEGGEGSWVVPHDTQ